MSINQRIKALRTERGLSARAVSIAAGLSASAVAQVERFDIESPRLETLQRIAKALDVPLATLLGEK